MITVERECVGLRFCGGEGDREMDEEMELEEGEAYSFHNTDGNDVDDKDNDRIDPDVAFSYMDVKIQDVLGHFQKDFEGGVSAENLGAKFGGYGSFLPTYQRSPVWPRSRSSASPSPLEGPRRNVPVSEIQKHEPVQSSSAVLSQSKQRSIDSSKQEKCMPPLRTVEDENSYESASRKSSTSIPDQKMLKLRIRVGSTDNKAAIYSGLGLDGSPSYSLDESPSDSEGMSCGPIEMGFDSPTSILQMMTSLPLNGDLLLSPLSDDLIHLTEKKKSLEGQKGEKLHKKKIPKLEDRKGAPVESKSSSSKKSKSKELDVDSLACEDIISKTLELPIISGTKGPGSSARVDSVSHRGKEEMSHLAGKFSEDKRESLENNASDAEASSIGKKKLKGSQNEGIQLADPAKESLSRSSSVSKSKKSTRDDISKAVSENGELKSRKVLGKGRDLYKDFFGDIEQEEENRAGTAGPDSRNRQDSGPVGKCNKLKERAGDKITAKASTSELPLDTAPDIAPPASAPFVIKENWVLCDKCEKWRLLPVGKDPNSLPKKWLCSMLDWLPGKNRCSVSEDETNHVLSQSYALAPSSHSNMPLNSEMPGLPSAASAGNPVETRLARTPEATSVGGKKKNSMKPIIQPSVAGGPTSSEQGGKSKQRAYEGYSDGGDPDTMRFSKKVRNRDIQSADDDHRSAGGSGSRKVGKNEIANDGVRIPKPDFADDVPVKQRRDLLEKGMSETRKSVLKKRNRDHDSEDPIRDNNEHRKGKKARTSKIDGRESSDRRGPDGAMNSARKGEKDMQPSMGPASNSYKANKSKTNLQEIKGSPAESVSSSPMRSSKPDMHASVVGNGVNSGEKGKNRSSKYESEADKGRASDGDVKPRDSERKRMENEQKRAGKNDSAGKTCGNDEKSLRRGSSSRADQTGDETRIRKSKALPPSGARLTEAPHGSTKVASRPTKVNKAAKPSEAAAPANGTRHQSDRRDSFTQAAANAIKEAKDLKHMADRVMASGSNHEGTGLYFQAALKFLHGASLLESSFNANSKYSEMIQSVQTYSSTAKLCEFCAHEYEKSKDMASAALAYKCMEVAYMKVVYSSQSTSSRDRQELQTALKLIPPGESPSSSASDVDHVNNKSTLPKDENPSQVAGNHIITARNRPNFERLLNFAQDVNSAMEASRRSMAAFNAAGSKSGDAQHREIISAIKRAIDFNFQDVDGLLQLVRIATEAISR